MASLEGEYSLKTLIKGLDEQRDTETRNEVYRGIIGGYLDTGKGRKLKLMVVGEAGQGKSTLINALVGQEVAREGDDFDAGTNEVKEYFFTQNGVKVGIWDTPGFGMGTEEEDEKIVEQLENSDCNELDLTLFCIRMDSTRIPSQVHKKTIRKLTEVFHKGFWKYTMFVLTFANNVQQLCPQGEEMEFFFSQRCEKIENKLRGVLQDQQVGLSDEELACVRVVPVGSCREGPYRSNPWALPDREDWFLSFWMDVSEHMHSSALSALLQANHHRLEATPADDGTYSRTKSYPPPPQLEPHERLLETTTKELSEIEQKMQDEDVFADASIVSKEGGSHGFPSTQVKLPVRPRPVSGETPAVEEAPAIHNRKIPINEILENQLKKENSGFFTYVAKFAELRGAEVKVVGHVGGFIEGVLAYLTRNKKK